MLDAGMLAVPAGLEVGKVGASRSTGPDIER